MSINFEPLEFTESGGLISINVINGTDIDANGPVHMDDRGVWLDTVVSGTTTRHLIPWTNIQEITQPQ